MAHAGARLPQNAAGDFFVDRSCIDCDACRQIAPTLFHDHGGQSSVRRQPSGPDEVRRAMMALTACPTGSIGTAAWYDRRIGTEAFPEQVAPDVFFCGFTSRSSFGAWSYLIRRSARAGGNVLVDSPRFAAPLVRALEALGGVSTMFLTHRDDVADHAKFASRFGCRRVMSAGDGAGRLGVEDVLEEGEDREIADGLTAIATPGHTRGHVVLLAEDRFLFSGDHLAGSTRSGGLVAFHGACWHSWTEQIRSMEKLRGRRFEWVLPGHGRIRRFSAARMQRELDLCIAAMRELAD
jgi:glyoxylase-like metal-dependent hydrolase (beta-lactamase superfamily II)